MNQLGATNVNEAEQLHLYPPFLLHQFNQPRRPRTPPRQHQRRPAVSPPRTRSVDPVVSEFAGSTLETFESEYKRGISGWNFNIDDMKAQAALDVDEKAQDKEPTNSLFEIEGLQEKASCSVSSIASCSSKDENDEVTPDKPVLSSPEETTLSLSMKSIGSDDEFMITVPSNQNLVHSERQSHGSSEIENLLGENCESEINEKLPDGAPVQHSHERKASASSSPSDIVQPSSRGERMFVHLSFDFVLRGVPACLPGRSKGLRNAEKEFFIYP
ncbi:hypothetical protein Taro_033818 [Colocasia esculenta]|uniref:Uncharacterized protein n=1 Tax=Colocasia esculenta TaxID=4460 RepID=A0A843W5T8_COLES|nr:hypothetical protein [Colocasia esculenta]